MRHICIRQLARKVLKNGWTKGTAIQHGASALGSCTNERVRQHQEAFTGAQGGSLSPLQLAICGCFVQLCAKEGVSSLESVESIENICPMLARNSTPRFPADAFSSQLPGWPLTKGEANGQTDAIRIRRSGS
jgi:hypothetical protein